MAKPWPNTETWQLVTGELKKVKGRSWRSYGELVFDVHSGQLRCFVDREHTEAEAEYIERRLAVMHQCEIERLTAALADAKADAAEYREKQTHRESIRRRDRCAEWEAELDEMLMQMMPDKIKEAA